LVVTSASFALDADDLDELLGYTMISSTHFSGEFEGADFDKSVKLDNGMVFWFTGYNYNFSFRPAVAVFAKSMTPEELRKYGIKPPSNKPFTFYKLVIDDEIYDVIRVR